MNLYVNRDQPVKHIYAGSQPIWKVYKGSSLIWRLNKVNFRDWDSTVLKYEEVVSGNPATPLQDPTREGYTFAGWEGSWTDIQADIDVIATYTANQYTVTFNPDGGTVSPPSKPVIFGAEYGELPTPEDHPHDSQQVFSFVGWFTEPNGGGDLVEENTLVSTPSDHTLYAAWSETTYTSL